MGYLFAFLCLFCIIQCDTPQFDVPTADTFSHQFVYGIELFEQIIDVASIYIEETIYALSIPDFSGIADTSIGEISYSIEDFLIYDFSFGNYSLAFNSDDTTIAAQFINSSLAFSFNYAFQLQSWPYTSEEGSGAVVVQGLDIGGAVMGSRDASTGTSIFSISSINVALDEFSVELDGGIIAAVIDILAQVFDEEINAEIAALIEQTIYDFLEPQLDKTTDGMVMSCQDNLCFDRRLATDYYVADTYFTTSEGGTFFLQNQQELYDAPSTWTQLPQTVNARAMQGIYGPNTFITYFDGLFDYDRLAPTACAPDGGDTCAMASSAYSLLDAEQVAAAFPEFAAAFPGQGAAVSFGLVSAPVPEILYSALEIWWDAFFVVAPYDSASASVGTAAVSFSAEIITSGELDFIFFHGSDAPIDEGRNRLSIEFSAYSAALTVTDSEIGDVTVSDALNDWAEDVFFAAGVDGAWKDTFSDYTISFLEMDLLFYTDHVVIYNPDYVAVTADSEPNWGYFDTNRLE
eukprot:gnl/Chilomastix_cuspidata/833.p1 GENE.gnl/Chilomastix_cuspidata/833~~gnl/Chilomastix_cuspidata/833.p1  ORF type:complete len:540 (+),score=181.53 gnl/Chilomastix_cuspidata/833:69-1622(+)